MKTKLALLLIVTLTLITLTGCSLFTRTVYPPYGTPVRLRERVPGVKVWVKDKNKKSVAGTMDLPEGWFAMPMPGFEKE